MKGGVKMDKEKAINITTQIVTAMIENAVNIDLSDDYCTAILNCFDAIHEHMLNLE